METLHEYRIRCSNGTVFDLYTHATIPSLNAIGNQVVLSSAEHRAQLLDEFRAASVACVDIGSYFVLTNSTGLLHYIGTRFQTQL